MSDLTFVLAAVAFKNDGFLRKRRGSTRECHFWRPCSPRELTPTKASLRPRFGYQESLNRTMGSYTGTASIRCNVCVAGRCATFGLLVVHGPFSCGSLHEYFSSSIFFSSPDEESGLLLRGLRDERAPGLPAEGQLFEVLPRPGEQGSLRPRCAYVRATPSSPILFFYPRPPCSMYDSFRHLTEPRCFVHKSVELDLEHIISSVDRRLEAHGSALTCGSMLIRHFAWWCLAEEARRLACS